MVDSNSARTYYVVRSQAGRFVRAFETEAEAQSFCNNPAWTYGPETVSEGEGFARNV